MAELGPTQPGQLTFEGRKSVRHYIETVIGPLYVVGSTKVVLKGTLDNWAAVSHLAPSTVHRMAATLHALFQYAVDYNKRLDNPADDLKLPEVAQGDLVELTLDDYGRLAQALGDNSTVMWLGGETGLRWGECGGCHPNC
jgi:integrase